MSKFIHGTAVLFPELVQAVPYWVDDEVRRRAFLPPLLERPSLLVTASLPARRPLESSVAPPPAVCAPRSIKDSKASAVLAKRSCVPAQLCLRIPCNHDEAPLIQRPMAGSAPMHIAGLAAWRGSDPLRPPPQNTKTNKKQTILSCCEPTRFVTLRLLVCVAILAFVAAGRAIRGIARRSQSIRGHRRRWARRTRRGRRVLRELLLLLCGRRRSIRHGLRGLLLVDGGERGRHRLGLVLH